MKKITFVSACLIALASLTANAQSTADLIKQKAETNKLVRKELDLKLSKSQEKEVKKEVKNLEKEGWKPAAGSESIMRQLSREALIRDLPMSDGYGGTKDRYLFGNGYSTAKNFNAAYGSARVAAQNFIAAMIGTEISSSASYSNDTRELDMLNSQGSSQYNERIMTLVSQNLKDLTPIVILYRELPNGDCQVQVRLAFDKMILEKIKDEAAIDQLKQEGDDLLMERVKKNLDK